MRPLRSTLPNELLQSCAVLAGLLLASVASAHGSLVAPESRVHHCRFGGNPENHADAACRAAIAVLGPQPIYDWNGVRQPDARGRHRELIPDGQLCSGGNPTFAGLDLPRSDWRTTPLVRDANGEFEFVWHATAPHATQQWSFYVTKPGFDPATPLRWSDLELFCSRGDVPLETDAQGRPVYRMRCSVPERTGRHLVYVTWQRADSGEAFYACSDVTMGGGPATPAWQDAGVIAAPTDLAAGTTVTFRLFDENGRDLEQIPVTLTAAQGAKNLWPYHLGLAVNSRSGLSRIGVQGAGGSITPSTTAGANRVYVPVGRALRFTVDVKLPPPGPSTPPAPGSLPVYPNGIGSYGPGTKVRGSDGLVYECRPFPNSGWCNQAPAYYAPGTGLAWPDAWIRRK